MEHQIHLFVKLKIPDVTAITARNTLQRRLGYGEILRDLEREDYWAITVEVPDAAAAEQLGTELAERTNVFVNPNKHTYRLTVGQARPEGAPPREAEPGQAGPETVRVLTGFLGDATARLTQDALQTRLGYGDTIVNVERGTLWNLTLRADNPEQARQIAEEITVTRGGQQGLLINPHSQWWRFLE